MKTESEIKRARELLRADCQRLGSTETARNQRAMAFALAWVLDQDNSMPSLLAYIERTHAEQST